MNIVWTLSEAPFSFYVFTIWLQAVLLIIFVEKNGLTTNRVFFFFPILGLMWELSNSILNTIFFYISDRLA